MGSTFQHRDIPSHLFDMPLPTRATPSHHTKETWPKSRESRHQSAKQESANLPPPNFFRHSYPFSNPRGALLDRHGRFHVDLIANGLAHVRLDPSVQRMSAPILPVPQLSSRPPPPRRKPPPPQNQKEPPSHLPRMHNPHQQPLVLEAQPNLSRKEVGCRLAHPV